MRDLYVRKEHINQVTWSKQVDYGLATLSDVLLWLRERWRCTTCGGTGRVEVDVPHAGTETWAEDRPCPHCVDGMLTQAGLTVLEAENGNG